MSKKMRLWMAGTVGVLMAGFMSVSVYALEEKDVIGTWYVNELSMGYYTPIKSPMLYNKLSSTPYDVNITVKESDIRNGTELILI